MRFHKLCDRDQTHYSIDYVEVLTLRDEHVVTGCRVGSEQGLVNPNDKNLVKVLWWWIKKVNRWVRADVLQRLSNQS